MSADNRTVATDALATLGTIITEKEKRDAIHLAVIPAIAGQELSVGADVGIYEGKAYHRYGPALAHINHVGIVDPFLKKEVKQGERFWLVIYPRMITSLRHVWVHPAFPDETTAEPIDEAAQGRARARLQFVANGAGFLTVDELLEEIEGSKHHVRAQHGHEPDTQLDESFWRDWSLVTGKPMPSPDDRPSYFKCTC